MRDELIKDLNNIGCNFHLRYLEEVIYDDKYYDLGIRTVYQHFKRDSYNIITDEDIDIIIQDNANFNAMFGLFRYLKFRDEAYHFNGSSLHNLTMTFLREFRKDLIEHIKEVL